MHACGSRQGAAGVNSQMEQPLRVRPNQLPEAGGLQAVVSGQAVHRFPRQSACVPQSVSVVHVRQPERHWSGATTTPPSTHESVVEQQRLVARSHVPSKAQDSPAFAVAHEVEGVARHTAAPPPARALHHQEASPTIRSLKL
jgi:hypothetical protein